MSDIVEVVASSLSLPFFHFSFLFSDKKKHKFPDNPSIYEDSFLSVVTIEWATPHIYVGLDSKKVYCKKLFHLCSFDINLLQQY